MSIAFRATVLALLASGLVLACGGDDGKPVHDASCSKSGTTFTAAECKVIGDRESCDTSGVKADGSGCTFDSCLRPPTCM